MIGEQSVQSRGLLVHRGFPVKTYTLTGDFERIYGNTHEALREVSACIAANEGITSSEDGNSFLYSISIPWGYIKHGGPVRQVDFYGFYFDREFEKGNPEWGPYILRNNILQPKGPKGCETGLLVLGAEALLRRVSISKGYDLLGYLNQWAELGLFGPVDKEIARLEI